MAEEEKTEIRHEWELLDVIEDDCKEDQADDSVM